MATKKVTEAPASRFSKCAQFLTSIGFKTVIRCKDNVEYLNIYVNGSQVGYMCYDPKKELNPFYAQASVKVLHELYNQSRRVS